MKPKNLPGLKTNALPGIRSPKGFLGPIGDDLPSLIPLIFALMMFFYVFTFTWNVFDQRSKVFDDAISVLRVGNTLKGGNYVRGIDAFNQKCAKAQNMRNVKFLAGLIPLSTSSETEFAGLDVETLESDFFSNNGKQFICSNIDLEEEKPGLESSNLFIRSFPIALEFANPDKGSFYIRPMLLVVVTWR